MTTSSDVRNSSMKRRIILGGLVFVGVSLAVGSWLLSDNGLGIVGFRDPWLSAFAANVSVVVVLLAPGEWFLGKLRQDVSRVEKDVTQAKGDAKDAGTAASAAKSEAEKATAQAAEARAETAALKERMLGLQELGRQQTADTFGAHQEILAVLQRPIEETTQESILSALQLAEKEGLIPDAEVRCPVPLTKNAHLLVSARYGYLNVALEAPVRNELTRRKWVSGQTPQEFISGLTQDLDNEDFYRGADTTQVVDALQELFDTLAELAHAKVHKPVEFRKCLEGQFFEKYQDFYFAKRWLVHSAYFASDSSEAFDDPRVRIPVDRSTLKLLADALPSTFPTLSGEPAPSRRIVEYVESLYRPQTFDKFSPPIR